MTKLTPEIITAQIVACVRDELNRRQPGQTPEIDAGTVLVGPEAVLDSLGLVTFAVSLEQRLSDAAGVDLIIADEQVMTQRNSPFQTVSTLTEYVSALIESASAN